MRMYFFRGKAQLKLKQIDRILTLRIAHAMLNYLQYKANQFNFN